MKDNLIEPFVPWYWENEYGNIVPYSRSVCNKLELSYSDFLLDVPNASCSVYVDNKIIYGIDFRKMTQTNAISKKSRPIKRGEINYFKFDRYPSFPSDENQKGIW